MSPPDFELSPPTVAIITGTIGSETLRETIMSVQRQTVPVEHWIVIDGAHHEAGVKKMIGKMPACTSRTYVQKICVLTENTGGNGYLCHRINGALPWLVDTRYVCFLDEDNEIEARHVEKLLHAVRSTPNARWAYTYRSIIDDDGVILCKDVCESLGSFSHTVLGKEDRLIDTNCYLLERELAIQISPLWNVKARQHDQLEADRQVCQILLQRESTHGVVKDHTVRYRIGNRVDSVGPEFFKRGNAALGKGVGGYDISKKTAYLFHFDAQHTAFYCHGDQDQDPLGEWCPGMWHSLRKEYNLVDGFANLDHIPPQSLCLITMCSPQTLPLDIFRNRKDLCKILYTAEGPNIRHASQWSRNFLKEHFDTVLTHWTPLLEDADIRTVLCPHNARFLSFPKDDAVLLRNRGKNSKTVVVVLERRALDGDYMIDNHSLMCLDPLRERFVTGLTDVTVIGNGWADYCATHPTVKLGYSLPRHLDKFTPIDHYVHHDFALIVENCNAAGYVSEKFGDAYIAGAIPLYYGNPSKFVPLPEGTYIDIRPFKNGEEVQKHLDSLSEDDLVAMKLKIEKVRKNFLNDRGRDAISSAVSEAIRVSQYIPT